MSELYVRQLLVHRGDYSSILGRVRRLDRDVVMLRTDGNIVYCGQKDRQIELGTIEDVINKYQPVQRAAVLIRNFPDAPAVVVFVEFKSSVTGDHVADEKEVLKMYISERLPRFMYPSLIARLGRGWVVENARCGIE